MLDCLNEKPFGGLQVGRDPVHDAVADEVDERVGHRDRPQVPVVQHVLEEDLAEA